MERKGGMNCDPGWNDPPLFSYESQSAVLKTTKPRTFLNKRVSFSLNDTALYPCNSVPVDPTRPLSDCGVSNLPPPPSVPLNLKETRLTESVAAESLTLDSAQTLETVLASFRELLHSKFQNDGKDKSDIQRRLDVMEKMWSDNKLCEDIHYKLLQLSNELKNGATDKADDLQKGLMVDHGTVCSPWMSGIRSLIHLSGRDVMKSDSDQETSY